MTDCTHVAGKALHLLDRKEIPYKPPSAKARYRPLVSNAWIQLKIVKYWRWFWRQWCSSRHWQASWHNFYLEEIYFGLQVQGSWKLIPCYREVFSHPTSPFSSLLVNGFCVATWHDHLHTSRLAQSVHIWTISNHHHKHLAIILTFKRLVIITRHFGTLSVIADGHLASPWHFFTLCMQFT